MKSLIMIGGFCITSVVSAIATSWTTVCNTSSVSSQSAWKWASNSSNNGVTYRGNADFAMRVTFTDVTLKNSLNDWKALLGFTYSNHTYSFQNNGTALWVTNKGDAVENFFSWEGEKDFSVTLAYDDTAHTLTFWLDDARLYTMSGVTIDNYVTFGVGHDGTSWRELGGIFSDGSYKVEYTDDIGLVPEPTVLALLALGVAGLALRRRTS